MGLSLEEMNKRSTAFDIWYESLGGKELNYLLSTLENFKLSNGHVSQDVFDKTFEKVFEHWDWS